jgi:hypothetical protein
MRRGGGESDLAELAFDGALFGGAGGAGAVAAGRGACSGSAGYQHGAFAYVALDPTAPMSCAALRYVPDEYGK